MSFTYDPDTSIGFVRLLLGDTVENSGVLPDGRNFTDEEIESLLVTQELSEAEAAVTLLETAANTWVAMVDTTIGPLKQSFSQAARRFESRAEKMRSVYGVSSSGSSAHAIPFARNDGYAQEE